MKLPKSFSALAVLLCCFVVQTQAQTQTNSATPVSSATPASAPDQSSVTPPQAIDPAKEAEIRKLVELTGMVKTANLMLDQMISTFKMRDPKVSPEFWDRFRKEINTEGLVDKIIPVYDKYYSLDDLKAVNAFYQTPAGQKVLAATPQVMHESMIIGQNWGREVAMKVQTEMAEDRENAAAAAAASATPTTNSSPTSAPPSP